MRLAPRFFSLAFPPLSSSPSTRSLQSGLQGRLRVAVCRGEAAPAACRPWAEPLNLHPDLGLTPA